jgi:GGDEF domain-containing protein
MDDWGGLGELAIAQTTVVTTCVILMTWLGMIGRPGRPTLLWTLGYFFALLGVYASFASAAMGINVALHPVGQSIGFGLPLLLWSGLRALNGRRPHAWAGFAQGIGSCVLLALTTFTPSGPLVFRLVFLAVGLSTAAVAIEALRGAARSSRYAPPLVASALMVLALAVVGAVYPLAAGGELVDPVAQVIFSRSIVITSLIFIITATVSLLFFANRRPGASDVLDAIDAFLPTPLMNAVVRERMLRARARSQSTWTFIEFRLDDITDLRDAGSEWSFNRIVERFEGILTREFAAEVDLARLSPGRVQVLAAHSPAEARDHVRTVLNALATPHDDGAASGVSVSASAGIVAVDVMADEYDGLTELARQAVDDAQRAGGDRWVRLDDRSAPAIAHAPRAR